MSELEKRQRDQYQIKRKKQITIQMIVATILILATLMAFLPCIIMSKNAYVNYAEDGKANTQVLLADNSFYDEEYLDSDHAYIASLIKTVETTFKYGLIMDADTVNYQYSYTIDATVNVIDKDSKAPIYDPSFVLKKVQDAESSDRELNISEKLDIDYGELYSPEPHSYGEGVVDAESGVTTYTCSACAHTKSEPPSEDTTEPEANGGGTENASNEQENSVSEESTSPENVATDPVLPPPEGSEDAENGTDQTEGQQDQE